MFWISTLAVFTLFSKAILGAHFALVLGACMCSSSPMRACAPPWPTWKTKLGHPSKHCEQPSCATDPVALKESTLFTATLVTSADW